MFILYATQDGVSQKIHWSYFSNCFFSFDCMAVCIKKCDHKHRKSRLFNLTPGQWQKICKIFKLYDLCLGTAFPPNPENLHQVKSFNFKQYWPLIVVNVQCRLYIIIFIFFTLGAEAAFIGAWLNSLIQILTGSQRRHFRGWNWSAPLIERHARCNQRRARGMMTSYFWMTWLFWDNLMGRAFHIGHLTPTKGWLGTKQTIFRKFAESFRIGWTPLWIWKVMLQRTMLVRIIYHR